MSLFEKSNLIGKKICNSKERCVHPNISKDFYLPISEFYIIQERGKPSYSAVCKKCQNKYYRDRWHSDQEFKKRRLRTTKEWVNKNNIRNNEVNRLRRLRKIENDEEYAKKEYIKRKEYTKLGNYILNFLKGEKA